MRLGRDVLDTENLEAGGLERADGRLASRAGALDEDLDLLQAVIHALPGARVGGDLRSERGRFARALEPGRAGGLPRDHVSVLVGQGDDRVVEARLDVRLADGDVLLDLAPRATARSGLSPRRRHLLRLLPAADRLLRALPRARVRLRPLAVRRQPAPVAEAPVGADLGEALDRLLALAAEVTLDLDLGVDVVAEPRDLVVGEVADLRVGREAERGCDLARRRLADAVDVRQPDLEPLLVRQVDSGDARQLSGSPRGHGGCPGRPHQAMQGRRERSCWSARTRLRTPQRAACGRAGRRRWLRGEPLALPLLVTGVRRADDHGPAVPLDDAAALAHGLD